MAEQKNQHYVPQFYLKNFSTDKKTIGSYVLSSEKFAPQAPIRSVCSENNFYENKQTEKVLSEIEAQAAKIISTVINGARSLSKGEINKLKFFVFLLHNRTLNSANQLHNDFSQLIDYLVSVESDPEIINNLNKMRLSKRCSVDLSMETFVASYICTLDLDLKIIENNTRIPFITSDDPVILYDQFLDIYKARYGLAMKGLQVILPISTKFALFIYDSKIYKVGTRKGQFISTITDNDVVAINILSVIYSNEVVCYKAGSISDCELKSIVQQGLDYKKKVSRDVEVFKIADSKGELIHSKGDGVHIGAKFSFVKFLDVAKAFIRSQSQSTTVAISDITRGWVMLLGCLKNL